MSIHQSREKYNLAVELVNAGREIPDACREVGLPVQYFYNYRSTDKRKKLVTTTKRPKVIDITPSPRVEQRRMALFVGTPADLLDVLRSIN